MLKKILLLAILAMSVTSCSLFDVNEWKEAHQERVKRGEKCYRNENGYAYCVDKYGNRTY